MAYSDTYSDGMIEWRFTYEDAANLACVTNDIRPADRYPVIDGILVIGDMPCLLDEDKYGEDKLVKWVARCWTTAVGRSSSLYYDFDTEFDRQGKFGFLTNDYCPLCLRRRRDFEVHHVIFKAEGGHHTVNNLLRICCSCHALINLGCNEDGVPRAMAALHHQLFHFGISFIPLTPPPTGKYQHVHPLITQPHFQETVSAYRDLVSAKGQQFAATFFTKYNSVMFKLFIAIIRGDHIWSRYAYETTMDENAQNDRSVT